MQQDKIIEEEFQAIIFDIDGVLVDVNNSYNKTIIKTVQYILKNYFNEEIIDIPFEKLISKFRQTGGFNNDIDTTYCIILIILFCIREKINTGYEIGRFTVNLLKKIDERGTEAVERELQKIKNIADLEKELKYYTKDNIITTTFNEIFYGPELYKKQFEKNPIHYFDFPFINNDALIIKEETLRVLSKKYNGNLILISGRSRLASYYTLDKLLKYFITDVCVFLEDEKKELSKPNTYALHLIFKKLNLKSALYIGDSAEDLLMVKKFRKETKKERIAFCGIYGNNLNISNGLKELFEMENADIIVENVNDITNILNIPEK